MDKSDVHLTDLRRIFIGEAPLEFMGEILIRTIIVYLFLLLIVKWLGKRMSGQLSLTELGIVIMLGAIVSPPMETPERGILAGILILFLVLFYHQSITLWAYRNPVVERITLGTISIFIRDGVIQVPEINRTRVTRAQIFARLRAKDIDNLGQVKRMYMEANGTFSIFPAEEPRPGLSVFPSMDRLIHDRQKIVPGLNACISCGNTIKIASTEQQCPVCGETKWANAIL